MPQIFITVARLLVAVWSKIPGFWQGVIAGITGNAIYEFLRSTDWYGLALYLYRTISESLANYIYSILQSLGLA